MTKREGHSGLSNINSLHAIDSAIRRKNRKEEAKEERKKDWGFVKSAFLSNHQKFLQIDRKGI